jgi:hypothetical protein
MNMTEFKGLGDIIQEAQENLKLMSENTERMSHEIERLDRFFSICIYCGVGALIILLIFILIKSA